MPKHELTITTHGDTEIHFHRVFDAPRRLVYQALTTPALVKQWFGARRSEVVTVEIDLRVGGAYLYVLRLPGGKEMHMRGTYRELGEERFVWTERFDELPGDSVITATLVERDGATTLRMVAVYTSKEVRDAVIASGMEAGAADAYRLLDGVLAQNR